MAHRTNGGATRRVPEKESRSATGTYKPWTVRHLLRMFFFQMAVPKDILARFGNRLRELRSAAGLSQESFADCCGLDRSYIGGVERGERNVSLRNIEIIAQALDISISKLTEGL